MPRLRPATIHLPLVLALWLLSAPPAASGAADKRFEYRQAHMGMEVRIVLYAPSERRARSAARAAFAEIVRLENIFSGYRRGSELNRLIADAGNPRVVSEELLAVLVRARDLSRLTDGAFDVTAGPLISLWRRAIESGSLPSPEAREEALQRVGFTRIAIDTDDATVTLAAGTEIDLGAIAKGFILDSAVAALTEHGVTRVLVEAGGDIVVGAAPPQARGWRVDVPHLSCVVELEHEAIATSGDEFQYVEIDGTRYSHVVDPRTGLGLSHGDAATVIADSGLTADALATATTVVADIGRQALAVAYPDARDVHAEPDCRR